MSEQNNNFNKLTPAETERLTLLVEEASEVIQVVGKIFRHGFESYHPDTFETNRKALERELGDLKFAVDFLCKNRDIDMNYIEIYCDIKKHKVNKYLHHNRVSDLDEDAKA